MLKEGVQGNKDGEAQEQQMIRALRESWEPCPEPRAVVP